MLAHRHFRPPPACRQAGLAEESGVLSFRAKLVRLLAEHGISYTYHEILNRVQDDTAGHLIFL